MTRATKIAWLGSTAVAFIFLAAKVLTSIDTAAVQKLGVEPNLFPFVRSLKDTRPDGNVKMAAADVLIIDADLRRLFDYYLSAVGEKSLDAIREEIEVELERRLRPVAAGEAKRILARYLYYKRELLELEKDPKIAGVSIDAIRARLGAMHRARARFFTESEIQAMFGFDDAYDTDALARLDVGQDLSLSAAQKQEKLAALDARLPPKIREARDAPLKVARLEELAGKMRAQGASEDDVYRMRAAAFSPEAAARLAEVDRDEAAWKKRIAAYLVERNTLIGNTVSLSETNRQTALQQLREDRFSPDERKRLASYE